MKPHLSRKDKIILTSIEIINELGVQGLSAQELARREEMAPSLIYKYFKGMDEIVFEVIAYYSRYDSSIINSILVKDISPEEKIMDFIRSYIEYYENYPAITALVNAYESLKHDEGIRIKVESITDNRIRSLQMLVELAQKEGGVGSRLNPYEVSVILWGYFMNMILIWRVRKYSFRLKEEVMQTTKALLECL